MQKLDALNAGRRAYIDEISEGLRNIPGLHPVERYAGTEPAGFFGFPLHYRAEELHGLPAPVFADALRKEGVLANNNPYPAVVGEGVPVFSDGVSTNSNPYPLLHTLPLFAQGLDIYTEGRGSLCTPAMGRNLRRVYRRCPACHRESLFAVGVLAVIDEPSAARGRRHSHCYPQDCRTRRTVGTCPCLFCVAEKTESSTPSMMALRRRTLSHQKCTSNALRTTKNQNFPLELAHKI